MLSLSILKKHVLSKRLFLDRIKQFIFIKEIKIIYKNL